MTPYEIRRLGWLAEGSYRMRTHDRVDFEAELIAGINRLVAEVRALREPDREDEEPVGCFPHQLVYNPVLAHFVSRQPLPTEGVRLKVPRLKDDP